MIITCPQCRTRYEVADQAIGDTGRAVQCANCSTSWYADRASALASLPPLRPLAPSTSASPEKDEDALDVEFQEVAAASEPPDPTRAFKKRTRLLAQRQRDIARALPAAKTRRSVSIVAIAVAISLLAGLVTARESIVRAVPDLASFYSAVGLGVNVEGLEFTAIRTDRAIEGGRDVLIVRGEIENVSGTTQPLPPIRVSLYRGDGTSIYEWQAVPGAASLDAGRTLIFETRLTAPPPDVARVRLRFEPGQRTNAAGLAPTQPAVRN